MLGRHLGMIPIGRTKETHPGSSLPQALPESGSRKGSQSFSSTVTRLMKKMWLDAMRTSICTSRIAKISNTKVINLASGAPAGMQFPTSCSVAMTNEAHLSSDRRGSYLQLGTLSICCQGKRKPAQHGFPTLLRLTSKLRCPSTGYRLHDTANC